MTAKSKKQATKITRIKASDTPKIKDVETEVEIKTDTEKQPKKRLNPLRAIGSYFKGAWTELKQVRWPTRRATWGLTLAVVLFTLFFVAFIVLLDTIFQKLFDLMLG